MAMLEDKIMKQGVWDGDDDDIRHGEDDGGCVEVELEENQSLEDLVGPQPDAPYVPPNRPGRKTGPKGVLADKRAHEAEKSKEATRELMKAKAMVHRAGFGVTRVDGSVSVAATAASSAAALRAEVDIDRAYEAKVAAEEAPAAVEEEEEDSFLEQYRAARLAELAAGGGAPTGPYGAVTLVRDAGDFLDHINDAPAGVFVVVHMWESFVPECGAVSAALQEVAPLAPHIKFLSVMSSVVKRNFDPVALPAFMVYLNGDTHSTEVRVTDLMLASHGTVSPPALADCLMQMGIPAPLLIAATRSTAAPAGPAPTAAAGGGGGSAAPGPAGLSVRRSSLRPNADVGAFMGAGSSVQGAMSSAADAGFDDMD